MLTTPITDADLASPLAALDALALDADFAVWCDARSDDAREHQDAALTSTSDDC